MNTYELRTEMGLEVVMRCEDSRESTEIRRVSIFDDASVLPDLINMCPSDGDSSGSDCSNSEVVIEKECSNISNPLHEATITKGINETLPRNSISRFPFYYQPQLLSCFDCGSESNVIDDDDVRDTSIPDLSNEPDDGSIFQIFSKSSRHPPTYKHDSFRQAFKMGLVAYFLSPKKKLPRKDLIEQYYSSRWNGHLPLAPPPSNSNFSKKRRRRYRHRSSYDSSFPCDLAVDTVDPCSKLNSHLVEPAASHTCNLVCMNIDIIG